MNKLRILIVLMFFVSFLGFVCSGKDMNKELQELIDKRCNQYYKDNNIEKGGLLIHIASSEGKYFVKNRMKTEVNENHHFRIGSITNTFTAAAVMMLHEQGRLNIKNNIFGAPPGRNETYMPLNVAFDIPYKSDITIEMLLNHRSGIFDVNNEVIPNNVNLPYKSQNYVDYIKNTINQKNHQFNFDELINIAATNKLFHSLPNQKFHYSGTDYTILGKIIEKITGANYSDVIYNTLIKPNELSNTYSIWKGDDYSLKLPYISAFMKIKGKTEEVTFDNVSANLAESDMISTPADMVRWIKELIQGNAGISPRNVNLMTTFKPTLDGINYGLGLSDYESLGVGNFGVHQGYVSQLTYSSDKDIAILIMNNFEDSANIQHQLDFLKETAKDCFNLVNKYIEEEKIKNIKEQPVLPHGEDE
jgi:D-alanyl-D-alanine carboxypeptidase